MIYKNIGALIGKQETVALPPTATVFDAAHRMAERRVGAVAVVEGDCLAGLFTERDLLNRVVASGRDPNSVTLREVMTRDLVTIREDRSLVEGLDLMFGNRFRHLPVLNAAGALVGVMSCRDVPAVYQLMRERWLDARQGVQAA
jgi:CBS domain-containing protein